MCSALKSSKLYFDDIFVIAYPTLTPRNLRFFLCASLPLDSDTIGKTVLINCKKLLTYLSFTD